MEYKRRLPAPQDIKAMYPLSEELSEIKRKNDEEIKKVFTGKCCPNALSPSIISGLDKLFGIKAVSTPEEDLKVIGDENY